MEELSKLTSEHFIEIAKIIDNNFIGNPAIVVYPMKMGVVRVIGHARGKQCINCDVKIDIYMNKLNAVLIQNEDTETEGAYRNVTKYTFKRVVDYLYSNGFDLGV